MSVPASTANTNQQVTDYENVIKACASVPKCVGVTVWDFTDKYSWVPSTFSGQGDACIWDSVSLFLALRVINYSSTMLIQLFAELEQEASRLQRRHCRLLRAARIYLFSSVSSVSLHFRVLVQSLRAQKSYNIFKQVESTNKGVFRYYSNTKFVWFLRVRIDSEHK